MSFDPTEILSTIETGPESTGTKPESCAEEFCSSSQEKSLFSIQSRSPELPYFVAETSRRECSYTRGCLLSSFSNCEKKARTKKSRSSFLAQNWSLHSSIHDNRIVVKTCARQLKSDDATKVFRVDRGLVLKMSSPKNVSSSLLMSRGTSGKQQGRVRLCSTPDGRKNPENLEELSGISGTMSNYGTDGRAVQGASEVKVKWDYTVGLRDAGEITKE